MVDPVVRADHGPEEWFNRYYVVCSRAACHSHPVCLVIASTGPNQPVIRSRGAT